MNYDVLGLIIQNVSKESYNTYIKDHILEPLHMEHTTFKRQTLKISTKPLVMNNQVERLKSAPSFNIGDTPSAFLMSNTKDLEHWIKMQLAPSSKTKDIVKASQNNK